MAGFDGYDRGDARNEEIESLLSKFTQSGSTCESFLLLPQNTQIFNLGVFMPFNEIGQIIIPARYASSRFLESR